MVIDYFKHLAKRPTVPLHEDKAIKKADENIKVQLHQIKIIFLGGEGRSDG